MKEFEFKLSLDEIPDNLSKKWEEREGVPENFVSVYHYTKRHALRGIAEKGLSHYERVISEKKLSNFQKLKIDMDREFDKIAKKMGSRHKRSGAVYALPSLDKKVKESEILLEIKVDPRKAIVGDARLVTAAGISWLETKEGKEWFKDNPNFIKENEKEVFIELQKEFQNDYKSYIHQYWQGVILLENWNKLSASEKVNLFKWPEVVIESEIYSESEGTIQPKFIRVKKTKVD